MTDQEVLDYYKDLLIIQYRGKTKARATVEAVISPSVADQIYTQVQDAFDIESAVGVQLDVIGSYAGVTRDGYNFSGPTSLEDDDFRTFIKVAILQNSAGSSLYDIQALINVFFEGTIFVFDYQDMTMSYFLDSNAISAELAQFFVKSGLLPKPMGVRLRPTVLAPEIQNYFGFRTYLSDTPNNAPFNAYDDYQTDRPWLTYQDAVVV